LDIWHLLYLQMGKFNDSLTKPKRVRRKYRCSQTRGAKRPAQGIGDSTVKKKAFVGEKGEARQLKTTETEIGQLPHIRLSKKHAAAKRTGLRQLKCGYQGHRDEYRPAAEALIIKEREEKEIPKPVEKQRDRKKRMSLAILKRVGPPKSGGKVRVEQVS